MFDTRVEFEDTICLKEANVTELKKLIQVLSETVVSASNTELQVSS